LLEQTADAGDNPPNGGSCAQFAEPLISKPKGFAEKALETGASLHRRNRVIALQGDQI
jgi:hypothetical protein